MAGLKSNQPMDSESQMQNHSAPSRDLPCTLIDFIDTLASHGEKPAVLALTREGSRLWSYAELARRVERLAQGLAQRGVRPGDPVALLAGTSPESIAASLAVIKAGAVIVPLDVQFAPKVLKGVLKDSGANIVLSPPDRLEDLSRLELGLTPIVLDDDAEGALGWQSLPVKETQELPSVAPADPAALFYTSGTTGPPKGVPLSHRNLAFQLAILSQAAITVEGDRVLLPLPLHHVYPFVMGVLAPLALGLTIVLPHALVGPQIIRALQEGQVTVVIGVPRLYAALYAGLQARFESLGAVGGRFFELAARLGAGLRRRFDRYTGKMLFSPLHRRIAPQLRVLASGGAALDAELAWRLEGLGWQIAIGYGLTETAPLLTLNLPGSKKLESVGKPVAGVEIQIDTAYSGEEDENLSRSPDANTSAGEILARGPGIFTGYHNLPDKTQEAFTEEGWFRTGDLGRFDEEGYLYVLGRVSTLIVSEGGENIQPEEVEEAYQASPFIRELGVLQKKGRLVAVIVPEIAEIRRRGESDIEQAIHTAVSKISSRLPSYQRLSDYGISRDSLARTRLGKLRRHLLSERYEEAKREERAPQRPKGPLALEEMADQDLALLENSTARQTWDWLARRYRDYRLTPDTSPALDLGVDSLEWLNLTLELQQQVGVELSEDALGRIETVRDLLRETADAASAGARGLDLAQPEKFLDERQRRWLKPLGPSLSRLVQSLYGLNRYIMRALFHLQVEGLEHVPLEGQCVLTPNHVSYLDPFAIGAALDDRRLNRTYWGGWTGVAFRGPIQRLFSRLAHVVPIDPDRKVASSLALGAAVLKGKNNLVWFPEGGRSANGKLQPFKPGIGMLLDRFPVPVIPVFIRGAHEALPRGKFLPRLRPITVSFGAPLDPKNLAREGSGEESYQRLVSALHERMIQCLEGKGEAKAADSQRG